MATRDDHTAAELLDEFDAIRTKYAGGLPGVVVTKQATVEAVPFLHGVTETFIAQTIKHDGGETILLQILSGRRSVRLVIPPKVTAVIYRQRDAASTMLRSRVAKNAAADRKARGIEPGFMKGKRGK